MRADYSTELTQCVAIFLIGGAIGWLTGLSQSPVVSVVISGVIGLACGIFPTLRKTDIGQRAGQIWPQADARPAAILVLGIALLAPVGIIARTHEWFGIPADEGARQQNASQQTARGAQPTAGGAGLFAIDATKCGVLLSSSSASNEVFIGILKGIDPVGERLVIELKDPATIRRMVWVLCNESR